jgi:tRNA synthetases class I (E and Q), catalytic domain
VRRTRQSGPPYPGTCRDLDAQQRTEKQRSGIDYALRLDVARALALTGPIEWVEEEEDGAHRKLADPAPLGNVVLARKDVPTSYHLAVTVDDAFQGVTLVTRGEDLAPATHVHRVVQALLDLPTPRYRHHELVTDATGRRLSKRDRALTIRSMRQSGIDPAEIIDLALGIAPSQGLILSYKSASGRPYPYPLGLCRSDIAAPRAGSGAAIPLSTAEEPLSVPKDHCISIEYPCEINCLSASRRTIRQRKSGHQKAAWQRTDNGI